MKLTATEQDFLILMLDVYFHQAKSSRRLEQIAKVVNDNG